MSDHSVIDLIAAWNELTPAQRNHLKARWLDNKPIPRIDRYGLRKFVVANEFTLFGMAMMRRVYPQSDDEVTP